MSDKNIIEQCSPTLANIKTGNLFTCKFDNKDILYKQIREINKLLNKKGIRVVPLNLANQRALIYVYRIRKLQKDILSVNSRKILYDYGYPVQSINACVAELARRVKKEKQFPHEIGCFLGYPPEDVLGFINNKAKNAKTVGCWKVYGNEELAKQRFVKYKKCTKLYIKMWQQGKSIERLTVAD